MDSRQLQTFAEVAKHLSFSKAAQSLCIAQSATSTAIKKLEHELDTALFNRDSKKVSLTPEGLVLLAHAEKVLAQMAEAKLEMRELKGLTKGHLSIAMPAMFADYYFPDIISEFMTQYPGISIQVTEQGTREIGQQLLAGNIDLGVVAVDQCSDALEVHPLVDEELVACVTSNHAFANDPHISFKQFCQEPIILAHSGNFLRELTDQLAQEQGVTANIIFETNLLQLMKKLVLNGRGISSCVRFALNNEQGLKAVPFDPPVLFRMGLAWRKGHYLSAANRVFVEHVLRYRQTD